MSDRVKDVPCTCKGIKVPHTRLEHDWCCQNCGGNHTERICPNAHREEAA
jgi:hypothetical protein